MIFHANQKNIKKFHKLEKYERIPVEASSAVAAPTRSNHYADKSFNLSKCENTPSVSADKIITQNDKDKNQKTQTPKKSNDKGGFER